MGIEMTEQAAGASVGEGRAGVMGGLSGKQAAALFSGREASGGSGRPVGGGPTMAIGTQHSQEYKTRIPLEIRLRNDQHVEVTCSGSHEATRHEHVVE